MFKKILFFLAIILLSGFSGIFAEKYLFPYLASASFFSKFAFLKRTSENITVINKTEQILVKEESSIRKVANQITPAIVNIISYSDPENGKKALFSASAQNFKNGTGQIITSDGIIMTYAGAIETETENIRYKILDGGNNVYDAQLLAVDSWSNVAFLKINASNLPVVSFADTEEPLPGEKIIVISNDSPVYQNEFAAGILGSFDPIFNISGKTFSIAEKMEGVYFIDFDSSRLTDGELVVDYSGKVIGLIGSVEKNGRDVFFQIPVGKIKKSFDRAIKKELEKVPAMLGIYYIPLTKSRALANNLSFEEGAEIFSASGQQGLAVLAGSPAAHAGLLLGDIITQVGEEKISLKNNLPELISAYKKGDSVELTFFRDGKERKTTVNF